jgi:hypothetical protein
MAEHEVRFRGELLGHFPSKEHAESHAQKHFAEQSADLSIEPRRAVELRCRGNLVDTFHTREGAEAAREKLATERAPAKVWTVSGP